ncbi:MAG: hypothetical protein JWQ66_1760 [Mucilaginibacter sp.]|nr:hypothetical protein [Mucilaginibacter sp.]
MKKLRPVPIFTIEGTSFLVDINKQVLRQTNDLENEISFINQMQDHGTFYRLLYDPDEKRAAEDLSDQKRVKVIDIPQLTELDPEGMALKYNVPIEQLKGKSDFDVMIDQEALLRRQQGFLPQIDIAGEAFTIDLRLQELRNTQYFFPVISLKSLALTGDGSGYEAFYHPVIKQVVEIDPGLTEFPEGVIKIQIPNELGLDPVATARKYGIEERELLRRYPIQKALKAAVIPLSETNVPGLIQRNREQLRREHEQIARRIKPKRRPHF